MTKQHEEEPRASERDTGLGNSRQPGPAGDKQRKEAAKSFFALVVGIVVSILLGLVGLVTSFFADPATTGDTSIQAVGILLGIVGYYLGAHRIAVAAVGMCIVVIFFGLAAGQDLILGIQGEDRSLTSVEPDA